MGQWKQAQGWGGKGEQETRGACSYQESGIGKNLVLIWAFICSRKVNIWKEKNRIKGKHWHQYVVYINTFAVCIDRPFNRYFINWTRRLGVN